MSKRKVKKSIYLTDQNTSQLKSLVSYVEDRIGEMEVEEEWMEENGENIVPLLRGLVAFLKEEHLESDEEHESFDDDEPEEDSYEEGLGDDDILY